MPRVERGRDRRGRGRRTPRSRRVGSGLRRGLCDLWRRGRGLFGGLRRDAGDRPCFGLGACCRCGLGNDIERDIQGQEAVAARGRRHTRDDLSRRRKAGVVAWRCGEHVAHHRDGGDLHRKRNEYRNVALERAKRGGPDHSVIALSAP